NTTTNIDGAYSLLFDSEVVPVITFSYVGYEKQELRASDSAVQTLNVALKATVDALDELVVIGYGTVKKADLTGAVSIADVEEMKKRNATTVTQALQGQVPGVDVRTNGSPGETGKIYVRGISSLYSDTNPLFVIDGLPTSDTRDFNPEDIESVQVLKDGSSAAIYGSRAANGVIIITTKHGKAGETKVNVAGKWGVQRAVKTYKLMDGPEWLALQEEKYANAGMGSEFNIEDRSINHNWSDEVFQTGLFQDYNASVSGGNQVINYMTSFNYFKHEGIVKGSNFDRFSLRVNGGLKKGIFKLEESLLVSTSYSHDLTSDPFTGIVRMTPLIPTYDEDGNYALGGYNGSQTNGSNPVAQRDLQQSHNRSYRAQGSLAGELQILPFLKYKLNFSFEFNSNIYDTKQKYGKWYPNQTPESMYYESRNHSMRTVIENILEFDKTFYGHHINAILGYTEQREKNTSTWGRVYDITKDSSGEYYWSLSNGTKPSMGESITPHALRSFLGRVMYDYDSRYFLTASFRRDGSSRFRKGLKYGNFPSASLAWRISNEKFFNPLRDIVSNLKVKASYGVLGNEAIGNFKYDTYINSFIPYAYGKDETWAFGAMPTVMADTSLQWEEKKTWNFGLEASFFHNALTLEADYFINKSDRLLAQVPIPGYIGSWGTIGDNTTTVWRNAGCVENRGFELSLGWKDYSHEFKYDVKVNLSTIRNKVLSLGGDNAPVYGSNTKTEVGGELGAFFTLVTDGIYQVEDIEELNATNPNFTIFGNKPRPGDQRYLDLYSRDENNNIVPIPDGKIDEDDRTFVGSPWPDLTLGLNFTAEYKDFDLSMYWTGSFGSQAYHSALGLLYNVGDNGNYISGLKGWTEENRSQTTPKVYYSEPLRTNSTRFIENVNYMRLKNLQFGYNLPQTVLKKIRIQSLRVYLNAENLLTITGYSGLDPEFQGGGVFNLGVDGNSYPAVLSFGGGIQITF
ncbi:MAG: TonB-dependent receptor, partial [Bacteroidaceae bacterium]|nr:TonB-dependent receptor [Bacteroidaceae bacterium]